MASWLVSCTQPDAASEFYHFWRVGTWEPGLRIDQERSGHTPCTRRHSLRTAGSWPWESRLIKYCWPMPPRDESLRG